MTTVLIATMLLAGAAPAWELLPADHHRAAISDVAMSADGATVVSWSYDGTVHVREAATGKLRLELPLDAAKADVRVAIDPKGQRLALLGPGERVHLVDATSGARLGALPKGGDDLVDLVFRPDGRELATGARDGKVRIWALSAKGQPSGKKKPRVIETKGEGVTALAYDPTGAFLVTAAGWEFATITVWDAKTGAKVRDMTLDTATEEAHPSAYVPGSYAVAVTEGARWIAAGGFSWAYAWDGKTGLLRAEVDHGDNGGGPGVSSVALSADGRWLLTAHNQVMRRWDLNAETGPSAIEAELPSLVNTAGVRLPMLPDLDRVAWGDMQGRVAVTDLALKPRWTTSGLSAGVAAAAFSPTGGGLFTGHGNGELCTWQLEPTQVGTCVRAHGDNMTRLVLAADGKAALTAGFDRRVRTWSLPGLTRTADRELASEVIGLAWAPGGKAAVGLASGDVLMLDPGGTEEPTKVTRHEQGATAIAVHGDLGASGGEDGVVRLWHARTGAPIAVLEVPPPKQPFVALAFSEDGKTLAAGGAFVTGSRVLLFDVAGRKLSRTIDAGDLGVLSLAWSRQGEIAVGELDRAVSVWDPKKGKRLARLPAFDGYGAAVAFDPSGKHLVLGTTGQEAAVRVWRRR